MNNVLFLYSPLCRTTSTFIKIHFIICAHFYRKCFYSESVRNCSMTWKHMWQPLCKKYFFFREFSCCGFCNVEVCRWLFGWFSFECLIWGKTEKFVIFLFKIDEQVKRRCAFEAINLHLTFKGNSRVGSFQLKYSEALTFWNICKSFESANFFIISLWFQKRKEWRERYEKTRCFKYGLATPNR